MKLQLSNTELVPLNYRPTNAGHLNAYVRSSLGLKGPLNVVGYRGIFDVGSCFTYLKESVISSWFLDGNVESFLVRLPFGIAFLSKDYRYFAIWNKDIAQIEQGQKWAEGMQEKFVTSPRPRPQRKPVPQMSMLVKDSYGEIEEVTRDMNWPLMADEEIELLYGLERFNEFVAAMRENKGLIFLNGEPGTGKTSLIKAAVAKMGYESDTIPSPKPVFLTPDNSKIMGEPAFTHYFLHHTGRILLCEDAENILRPRKEGGTEATSNLLNLTDGIAGEFSKVSFVASVNCQIQEIDTALLRPGRCLINWHVGAMSPERASTFWDYKHKQNSEVFIPAEVLSEPITLARLYQKMSPKKELAS